MAVFAAALAGQAMAQRPERNSFLNAPIHTKSELVKQVQSDPTVRDRYLRHYGMGKPALFAYLSSLEYKRLGNAYRTDIYSVPEDGHVKVHKQMLKRGEPVFVDASGHPVIRVRCGNPLSPGPDARLNTEAPANDLGAHLATNLKPLDVGDLSPALADVPDNSVALVPNVIGDETGLPSVVTPPVVPNPLTPEPTTPEPRLQRISPGSSGVSPLAFIAPLLVGGAIIGASNHGGNQSNPVPEPAPLVVFAAGVAALAARKRLRH